MYASCADQAHAALARVGSTSLEDLLLRKGLSVVPADAAASFGGTIVRARLELDRRARGGRIHLYMRSLRELEDAFGFFALVGPREGFVPAIVAHETFHALSPGCPPHLAEVAANLFATWLVDLPFYAGSADVVHVLYRQLTKLP